ncbi:hypothetical protein [Mammaliicoccus sp. A-M2]|uniref:hypothetical protein n=1 Tax=Mammaliicoccus sp. A-M2 TaxID=2898662 RepID=UPI001EFB80EE|nr:hypothetical protein [Mammaliicoccus sp. A-M2]
MNNSIFDYENDEYFALLNWQYHHSNNNPINTMAESYYETVKITMNHLIKNIRSNVIRDRMIFPVLFNFNHYIELKLKSCLVYLSLKNERHSNEINIIIKEVMGSNNKGNKIYKYPNTHDLSKILTILIKSIERTNIFENQYSVSDKLKSTTEYINDLYTHKITKGSANLDLFRFPLNLNQDNQKYVETFGNFTDKKNVGISIEKLRIKIIDISYELESLSEFLNIDNN